MEADYGSWKSPLTSALACDSSIRINRIYVDQSIADSIFWSECHPEENGRTLVFSKKFDDAKGKPVRWTPAAYDVYNTVHEYGGGSFFIGDGKLYFMNSADQRIYEQSAPENEPIPITKREDGLYRYADGCYLDGSNFFFCVREDHSQITKEKKEPINLIVCIDKKTGQEQVVAHGYDFYSSPRVSKDGKKLVWIQWNHDNMPWDNTEVWICDIKFDENEISFSNHSKVAGTDGINYMEPQWTSNNKLMYICDKTGFWNLYMVEDLDKPENVRNVHKKEVELGGPCWKFGNNSYSPHPLDYDIVFVLYGAKPSILSISSGSITEINVEDHFVKSCVFQPATGKNVYLNSISPLEPPSILIYNTVSQTVESYHESANCPVSKEYLSKPECLKFAVNSKDDPNAFAYGWYYKPKNKDYYGTKGTLPPLLIQIHGGPTSAAGLGMNLGKQYFTSRGFAILDVDYRGSTGHGTKFRNALKKKWGVYDIEDVCAGALYLAHQGEVDINKLTIDGGSAGGYTTLASLTFRDVFRCGASYYGVSDLEMLALETHKFESRYIDVMIAAYPEHKDIFRERSPYYHLDQFQSPCAFFQGSLDKVVPQDQAEVMYEALKKKGVTTSLVIFPDEAHGFKKSENKQKALTGEFYFYSKILGFQPADEGIEIPIENL